MKCPSSPADLVQLNRELTIIINNKLLTDPLNQKLVKRSNTQEKYEVDITQSLNVPFANLKNQTDRAADASNSLYRDPNQVNTLTGMLRNLNSTLPPNTTLAAQIDSVLSPKFALSPTSAALLDLPIAPSIDAFKAFTLRNGLLILKKLCQQPDLFSMILQGKAVINSNNVVAGTATDISSVQFLQTIFAFLKGGNLTTTSDAVLFQPVAGSAWKSFLDLLDAAYDNIQKLYDAKSKIAKFVADFPDLTLEVLVNNSLKSDIVSLADVLTPGTPYISVDAGIGYSPAYQQAFSYYGANFYFSPVNKKAKLSTFKGWNLVKKMLCGTVGVATVFGDRLPPYLFPARHRQSRSVRGAGRTNRPRGKVQFQLYALQGQRESGHSR